MVLASYGSGVDLHCGGSDLTFPHHACETMLAENATGVAPFARGWMRPGTVSLAGKKMAKSTGNLILVEDLLADHAPAAIRLLCLSRAWAQPWDYTPQLLEATEDTLQRLYAAASRDGSEKAVEGVRDFLRNDLDVPAALSLALDEGGPAARHLVDVLKLT
jgi:cysteinyl-tRNA synthetase